jgi:FtsZ-binding cell division protein ZapB
MISDFQSLSDKITQLAEMTLALRCENAVLRQFNAHLANENIAQAQRMAEAQERLEALLKKMPAQDAADPTALDEAAQ